jgi:hypothetical protein
MKLLQFGQIKEANDGRLEFSLFHVDSEGASMPADEVIAELAIARLQAELDATRKARATHAA